MTVLRADCLPVYKNNQSVNIYAFDTDIFFIKSKVLSIKTGT